MHMDIIMIATATVKTIVIRAFVRVRMNLF